MKYYDEISNGYDELHGEEQLNKAKIITNKLVINENDTLLDVGCGTGHYLDLFKCNVTGIDPSEELIKQYRGDANLIVGRAEKLPFQDDEFDIVISITAIHNFEDIEKGLREMRRVGKEKFAFTVMKKTSKYDEIEKLIKELFKINKIIIEEKDVIFFCNKKL